VLARYGVVFPDYWTVSRGMSLITPDTLVSAMKPNFFVPVVNKDDAR